MPSVRGRERVVVAGLLLASSGLTGALAGWAGGVAWSLLLGPALNAWALVVLVVGALALDLVSRVAPPLSVRRQVPQLWGRIFSAPTVAVLYGARLGVGPLTILRTWLWWAAFVAGASAGPWWGAGVGAAFGSVRIAAMLAAGTGAGHLQSRERVATVVLGAGTLLAVAVAGTAFGWSGADADADAVVDRATSGGDAAGECPDVRGSRGAMCAAPPSRPAGASSTSSTSSATTAAPPSPEDAERTSALSARLPQALVPGWERAPDDPQRRLGPLDLAAAAAAEADTPAERALLETRRFRRGHARGWRGPAGQVGYASVYEFASAADAAAYLVDGVTTIEARGARVYDVAAPAGGKGFSQAGQAAAGEGSTVSHGVVFVEGDRFFLVFVSGSDSSVDPTLAAQAAASVAGAG